MLEVCVEEFQRLARDTGREFVHEAYLTMGRARLVLPHILEEHRYQFDGRVWMRKYSPN
jgi:hypothetical protein